ncbi:unnamed protein product [Aphanomyces euteiches]|uniref:PRA1 family protein n=1 Tax=Aphanomyces euteiches TaxID=100861 RepID=A0A6G0XRC7_9STRA|nr:hypothetical protein Ae201684_002068 [Aphanomyces euteiches]KAH9087498.1 hypothetical protein Ae201684P_000903 [Aphanomyces euteiches]KAH9139551.1 hypothetical protein AeRB84_016173 [Aphanomyces euteiches]
MTEKVPTPDTSSIVAPATPQGKLDVVKAKLKDVVSLKNMRGVVIFFGIGEQKPFQVPAKEVAMNRTRKNLLYFATNYACVAVLVAFISILMNPFFLFILMCIGAAWYQNAQITSTETEENKFQVLGRAIDAAQRNMILIGLTAVLIIYFGGSVLFSIASMSALLSACHAFLRNSNIPDEDEFGFTEEVPLPEP